ncbi:MAG: hypothetical protein ACR2Q4_06225 [Geminicoccaceae bacterium]
MTNLSNLPLVLYLIAIPLISAGTAGDILPLTWLGFLALLSAACITPALRLKENVKDETPATQYDSSEDERK